MRLAWVLLFFALRAVLPAEQPTLELTLAQAVERALENSKTYQVSQLEVQGARQRLLGNLGFLPQVTLSGSKNLKEKLMTIVMPPFYPGGEEQSFSLDFTMNYEYSLTVVQPVFTGGKIGLNAKNAQLDVRIARERERDSRQETVLHARRAFYNIQVLGELLKAHQEALLLAENSQADIRHSFEQGMASQYDLLRAELAVRSARPAITQAETLLQVSWLGFKQLLGIPETQPVLLVGELGSDKVGLDLDGLIDRALAGRSEIVQLELARRKVVNLQKMAWAQFLPDFSIVASYNYRANRFSLRGRNWENYYTINLGVSWPIFTGLKRSAQVGEMHVARRIAELNLRQLQDATRLEIQAKYLTAKQEYENILLGQQNVETAREGVRIAELSYQEGVITQLELNSSHSELTRARVGYLQALYNYHIVLAELEKLAGIDLFGGAK